MGMDRLEYECELSLLSLDITTPLHQLSVNPIYQRQINIVMK